MGQAPFFNRSEHEHRPRQSGRSGSEGLSQRADDRPVGFLWKSLKRDGAQIAL